MIQEIESAGDPRIQMFAGLTESQLRNRLCPGVGIFIAESPKVIRVALDAGIVPVALLCEKKHIDGDAADIIARMPEIPVYTGSREVLQSLTGYKLTRGVLCAMRRPPMPSLDELCSRPGRLVVIDDVCDTTNIGSIFRSAAALGMDGVILNSTACDPLNRRAVRVSMGPRWTITKSGKSLKFRYFSDFSFPKNRQKMAFLSNLRCKIREWLPETPKFTPKKGLSV